MIATGRCLCGVVSYRAQDLETDIHACHCTMCRRWTGGPALAVKTGAVIFEGEDHIARYASSDWAERGFCSRCGSNLFYRLTETGQTILWLGTLDDPAGFRLASEIFVDEKPRGYDFSGAHPRLTGQEFLASMGGGSAD